MFIKQIKLDIFVTKFVLNDKKEYKIENFKKFKMLDYVFQDKFKSGI